MTTATAPVGAVDVEIVVPVHDEEATVEASVRRLTSYLAEHFPLSWVVTVADNASTDRTWGVACRLAAEVPGVQATHLDAKGRGRALRAAWTASTARVVAYMDVDLSTDLDGLLPLVAPLLSGHSEVAIGSRLAPGARVARGPKREVISRAYNLILRATLHNGFSDAQCGFKAVRAEVARAIVPMVADQGWFFDTELLALAERNGLRIHEVPVDWVDDPDSRVDLGRTALADLAGLWRVLRSFARGGGVLPDGAVPAGRPAPGLTGQLLRLAGVGAATTVLFAALFLLLAGPLGAVGADLVALAVAAVCNLAANRQVTFSAGGPAGRARHWGAGLALSTVPLLVGVAALAALGRVGPWADLGALTAVNGAATVARWGLLRRWVFAA